MYADQMDDDIPVLYWLRRYGVEAKVLSTLMSGMLFLLAIWAQPHVQDIEFGIAHTDSQ